jgi:hypothetical protein
MSASVLVCPCRSRTNKGGRLRRLVRACARDGEPEVAADLADFVEGDAQERAGGQAKRLPFENGAQRTVTSYILADIQIQGGVRKTG